MRSADAMRRVVRPLIIAGYLATTACTTPTIDAGAPPYDPTSLTGGMLYHWPTGRTIHVHVVPGGEGLSIEVPVHTGASRWTSALAFREHRIRIVDRADDADILVREAGAPVPVDTTGCGGGPRWTESAASTLFCPSGDTARTLPLLGGGAGRAKVLITVNAAAATGPGELVAVIVHEIGHALGIGGHSASPSDVMYAAPVVTGPSAADGRTLRYVLHRRPHLTL